MIALSNYFASIQTRNLDGQTEIFCIARKKWLIAQPEEFVRQAAVLHLLDLGYSLTLISVEREIKIHKLSKRYDIVVWNKDIQPAILVECKAPDVPIGDKEWQQAGLYNLHVQAPCLWITNGHSQHITLHNRRTNTVQVVDSLPLPAGKEGKMSTEQEAHAFGESWSYDHFIGFLLLYAAHADYDYSRSEEEHILSLISHVILTEVEKQFNNMGEFDQLQAILKMKEKFITDGKGKEKVLKALSDLFQSDGDYSRLESNLYDFLDRLL